MRTQTLALFGMAIFAFSLGCGGGGGNTDADFVSSEAVEETREQNVSEEPRESEKLGASPEESEASPPADLAAVAKDRRTAVVNSAIGGCRIGADAYASQFSPNAVAEFKNEECPRYGEWLAEDVRAAYEEIAAAEEAYYKDPTGDVWLDSRNVDYEGEVEAALVDGCDHMVNLMEDQSWEQRFRSLTEDGFPSRFCFDLES